VTVRADELALLEFGVELPSLAGSRKRRYVVVSRVTGKVIPLHGRGMEATTTNRAWAKRLHVTVQPDEANAPLFHLEPPLLRVSCVVRAVVLLATRLAPHLAPLPRVEMKLVEWLDLSAHPATLHRCQNRNSRGRDLSGQSEDSRRRGCWCGRQRVGWTTTVNGLLLASCQT
jgi:hypothetical protein